MAKTRFSISMDDHVAEQIKRTAAQLGEDVSSFMTSAAMEVVRRKNREKEIFAEIDAAIAAMEAAQPEPIPVDPELELEVHEQLNSFFAPESHRDVA
ncbi:putative peroxiredoxin [Kitasatospora sp. GAS204A]|uniref:hypothetical protein n=1 Tax=unclassified Kitasatospora TaxID=2633591 RepID=UPI002476E4F2|nr:hypothetical protein [Kitasatospora sp. GAS204B]MDH6115930.1 putative peroxiredoxin [Kitasatospora sp. GAS204B]